MRNAEAQIADLMRNHHRFLICSHMNPDGDALGSSLGLALYLEGEGKEAVVFNQDPVPGLYEFLPSAERIRQSLDEREKFDATFLLDCATSRRVGKGLEGFHGRGVVVVIDHHPPVEVEEGIRWIRTDAAATAELLFGVMETYGVKPSPDVATNLYAALMTDTGSFRFSNTTARSLTVAAGLLEAGADHGLLIDRLYESYPAERFRLLALALETLGFFSQGRVAVMHVTREMFAAVSAPDELTDGFVDIPRSVRGVDVAVLIREVAGGEHRVNLRSRGRVDVARVATRFGGGGHSNAAGCTVKGDGDKVRESVLAVLEEAFS